MKGTMVYVLTAGYMDRSGWEVLAVFWDEPGAEAIRDLLKSQCTDKEFAVVPVPLMKGPTP